MHWRVIFRKFHSLLIDICSCRLCALVSGTAVESSPRSQNRRGQNFSAFSFRLLDLDKGVSASGTWHFLSNYIQSGADLTKTKTRWTAAEDDSFYLEPELHRNSAKEISDPVS